MLSSLATRDSQVASSRPEAAAGLKAQVRVGSDAQPRLNVDLELQPGLTAVVGPSGAGKSTLLFSLAGLLVPEQGHISLNGRVLFDSKLRYSLPAHRRRIPLVFQSLALFPHLTAWQNVAYGALAEHKAERKEIARHWMTRMKIAHLFERPAPTLSGGEAQRVALARALAAAPEALLLDEPFSALDAKLREELGFEVREIVKELNLVALFVSHQEDEVAQLCQAMLRIEHGQLAWQGELSRSGDSIVRRSRPEAARLDPAHPGQAHPVSAL